MQGVAPSVRQGHAAVEVDNVIFVIGGCSVDAECYMDVHAFDTETLLWSQVPFTGDAPEPRSGHSATLLGANIYLFGGASSEATYGDAYKFDLIKKHWSRAVVAGQSVAPPSARSSHAAVADVHGRVYVFGGYDAQGSLLNDLWILDVQADMARTWADASTFPVAWARPLPTGRAPASRGSHTVTLIGRQLVVFGGYSTGGAVNDVEIFDVEMNQWVRPEVPAPFPWPRQGHAAGRHGEELVVVAGCDVSDSRPTQCLNDVWSLDTSEMRWARRSADVVSLFPREGHSANFVRGRLFVFGGCQPGAECFNDVTVLDTSEPCPASCGGHGQCVDVPGSPGGSFCRCGPGFSGHDCMQPLSCAADCGARGACSPSGQCVCLNGWAGPACNVELPCPGTPMKCSNHGRCAINGTCLCAKGFAGPDCSLSSRCLGGCSGHGVCGINGCVCEPGWSGDTCSSLVVVPPREDHCPRACCGLGSCKRHKCQCERGWYGESCAVSQSAWVAMGGETLLGRLDSDVMKKRLALYEASAVCPVQEHGGHAFLQVHDKIPHESTNRQTLDPPTIQDFGISESNPAFSGYQELECLNNCNFAGVCLNATCFCQPGFHGDTCETRRYSHKHSVSVQITALLAVLSLLSGFVITIIYHWLQLMGNRQKEEENGFSQPRMFEGRGL